MITQKITGPSLCRTPSIRSTPILPGDRITETLDKHGETQFGFRKGKSTAEPLFCGRRLTDIAEEGHEPPWLLFLDGEKAFDKLDHAKMFVTLSRLNMPENLIAIIKSLYRNRLSQVSHKDPCSDWFQQRTGIWQGCPLSPYLFILTMHCMFLDVKAKFQDHKIEKKSNASISMKYCSLTIRRLFRSARLATRHIHLIEQESSYLHLN